MEKLHLSEALLLQKFLSSLDKSRYDHDKFKRIEEAQKKITAYCLE